MKKVIRLTENDLTRIVRRVIKESQEDVWSDEDEKDYQEIGSKAPYLKDYNGDEDRWIDDYKSWSNEPKHQELKNKKDNIALNRRKKEAEKNANRKVVKGPWSDEDEKDYKEMGSKAPYLKNYGGDTDAWADDYEKWTNEPKHIEIKNKRFNRIPRYVD